MYVLYVIIITVRQFCLFPRQNFFQQISLWQRFSGFFLTFDSATPLFPQHHFVCTQTSVNLKLDAGLVDLLFKLKMQKMTGKLDHLV
jgi:hypothetical protein